VLKFELAGTQF